MLKIFVQCTRLQEEAGRVEEKVRKSNLSDKNKKIIFNFERKLFIKEFTTARIETYLSVLRAICGTVKKFGVE
ncbi:MAG TPA: hypothetical protein VIO11_09985 [Candidatus Methanoperedens sp.]